MWYSAFGRGRYRRSLFCWDQLCDKRSARDAFPQNRCDVRLKQFKTSTLLAGRHTVGIGTQVYHFVPELLVIAAQLVDHLLRTTDQRRAARDEILDRFEHRRNPGAACERQTCLEHWTVGGPRLLRSRRHIDPRGSGTDQGVLGPVAVELPSLPVVSDQFGVGLDGIADVRGEDRVTVTSGEVNPLRTCCAAVPNADSALQRAGKRLGAEQRRPEAAGPRHAFAFPQQSEQLVTFAIAVPLIGGCHVEQLGLGRAVPLADDQL